MSTAAQHSPDPTRSYYAFPAARLTAGAEMFRSHSKSRGAWFFGSALTSRFDLAAPMGTCYVAIDPETATREKVRMEAGAAVDPAFAENFVVSKVSSPRAYRCANTDHTAAAGFGVVRALSTMEDYTVTQAWAAQLHTSGFEGIFYGSAFTTGAGNSWALFEPAGERTGSGYTQALEKTGREACVAAGFTVAPLPPSAAFSLLP